MENDKKISYSHLTNELDTLEGGTALTRDLDTVEGRTAPWAQKTLMRNVYGWMSLALAITGLMAYYVGSNLSLVEALFSNQALYWGLWIAELALVWILSARIERLSFATAGVMFGVYSLLNGVLISSIFVVYTMDSIASTFFITAGMFASMAVIGTVMKKDLSGYGRFFMMALIGLIIASVVNIFLQSTGLDWIVSIVGVLLFTALTAYDAQKIKRMFLNADSESDIMRKYALLGALSLYLDFINLFLYLLRFFGNRRD